MFIIFMFAAFWRNKFEYIRPCHVWTVDFDCMQGVPLVKDNIYCNILTKYNLIKETQHEFLRTNLALLTYLNFLNK